MNNAILINKRITTTIHWLERLKTSYNSGRLESALMDAECARADLEALRQTVWGKVDTKIMPRSKKLEKLLKISILAMLIIMSAVYPISREKPVTVEYQSSSVTMAEPVKIIRIDEDVNDMKLSVPSKPKRTQKKVNPPLSAQKSIKTDKPNKLEKPAKKLAYDKVFSLVQTGQQALKNNTTVIIKE